MKVLFGNLVAIYRKELQSYFVSPLSYAIAGVFWFIAGWFFVALLLGPQGVVSRAAWADAQAQMGDTPFSVDWPYQFLQEFLSIMGSLSLFILPVLSMGLYAEERKRGTLELLSTSPVTNWVIALGKLLGVLTFFFTLILPILACELMALSASTPPMPLTVPLLGHLGWILLAASVLSLGMFISSLTDSTILAAILTFLVVVFLSVLDWVATIFQDLRIDLPWIESEITLRPVGEAIAHLSVLKHFSSLVQGLVDTGGIVMLASYIILGVFLTAQSIEAFRFGRS
jgi:ABC-2 type transport system permease protein